MSYSGEELTLMQAAKMYYAAQKRAKALSEEKDQVRHDAGFAATLLLNAVEGAGQKSKKFGNYRVHVANEFEIWCTCCATWANRCHKPEGPVGVTVTRIKKIWVSEEGKR